MLFSYAVNICTKSHHYWYHAIVRKCTILCIDKILLQLSVLINIRVFNIHLSFNINSRKILFLVLTNTRSF